ncbi:MAG: Threonylcarbamoyl-AMP synthase [Fimbriimonadaceae bacterium]|nr:Threonylcarbamoyl-AMP synthase [Fimbriimonadaceae bacterium]
MDLIESAAAAIRLGELVIMPTETVYGLAADATNPEAVGKIFTAKGRPENNPLIVHVDSVAMARECVQEWPEIADRLASAFWPGPLTLVLPKSPLIPATVTAGLDTVGVRIPNHPVALELIRRAGKPIAAPSANPANAVSPTRVGHLSDPILAAVAVVLDGGPCEAGIESTVVRVAADGVVILRPGAVSRLELAEVVPVFDREMTGPARSPGLGERHYSPRARVEITFSLSPDDCGLTFGPASLHQRTMPSDPVAYARELYDALHELDARNPDVIRIEAPPQFPEWEAVWDRLRRAASR